MKKRISLVMVVLLLVSVPFRAICGGQAEKKAEQITLTYIGISNNLVSQETLISWFEEEHPNVKLKFVQSPSGGADRYHDKLVTMFAMEDDSVDVVGEDVIWPPEFAHAGWLVQLDDYFPPKQQKDYIPAMIDAQTVGGHIFGVPYYAGVGHLFYRKDLLEEAGIDPPVLWSDLVEASQMLQSNDLVGFVACFTAEQQLMCNYVEYLWSNKGEFFDTNGNIAFTDERSLKAIQLMTDLVNKYQIVQKGILSMDLDEGRTIFTEGHAVFHRNWDYAWNMAQAEGSAIQGKVGVTRIPRFQDGEHHTCLGGWSWAVSTFSHHKEEAIDLALFLGSERALRLRNKNRDNDGIPAIFKLFEDPEIVEMNPVYPLMKQNYAVAKARPKSPYYTQVSDIHQRELQEAILLKKKPEQAMADAAKEIQKLISR